MGITIPTRPTASISRQEHFVRAIAGLTLVIEAERQQEILKLIGVGISHFEAGVHPPEVGAVIALVKQADVPSAAEPIEKVH